ncbi:MAG: TPM domain-containing protein [Burkholderiaceae bacterium]
MNIRRLFKHWTMPRWRVRQVFPAASLQAIGQAIAHSETLHTGQLQLVIEGALDGAPLFRQQTARERAIDVFAQQRVWDTEHNNGVLIYLLLADRDVEIVADRGIHARVGVAAWEGICQTMEAAFRQGEHTAGLRQGIEAITQLLAAHFPAAGAAGRNELPDWPVIL